MAITNPLKEVPAIGPFHNWLKKIGHVQSIINQPCSPTFDMWVLGFWSATPYALWSLFKPDPMDATYERFGRGHKKRRRYRFDASHLIQASEPIPKGMGWAVFKGATDVAQRIGWYMMIADVAINHAVRWSSLAMAYAGCPDPDAPMAIAHTADTIYEGEDLGTIVLEDWSPLKEKYLNVEPTYIEAEPVTYISGQVSVYVEPFFDSGEWGYDELQLYNRDTGAVLAKIKGAYPPPVEGFDRLLIFTKEQLEAPLNKIAVRLSNTRGRFVIGFADWTLIATDLNNAFVGQRRMDLHNQFVGPDQSVSKTLAQWVDQGGEDIEFDELGMKMPGPWGLMAKCEVQITAYEGIGEAIVGELDIFNGVSGTVYASARFEELPDGAVKIARAAFQLRGSKFPRIEMQARINNVASGFILQTADMMLTLTGDKGILADP